MDKLAGFARYLIESEKSLRTQKKYVHDVKVFIDFLGKKQVTKGLVVEYKAKLEHSGFSQRSSNGVLSAVNCFLRYQNHEDYKVKLLKRQYKTFRCAEEELSHEEYDKLLEASRDTPQIHLIIQTLAATGIRISELEFFTVEAVRKGEVLVTCKGKTRPVVIEHGLQRLLLFYCEREEITSGVIFVTRRGKPLDRTNIWRKLKKLAEKAGVDPKKVYPHNFRKLFARTFYELTKDLAKLADLLGHSNINTTRIYIMTTVEEHRRQLSRMKMLDPNDLKQAAKVTKNASNAQIDEQSEALKTPA